MLLRMGKAFFDQAYWRMTEQDEAFQMSREAPDCMISVKLANWCGTGQALLKQIISMMGQALR